jgi:hypothetical protein
MKENTRKRSSSSELGSQILLLIRSTRIIWKLVPEHWKTTL